MKNNELKQLIEDDLDKVSSMTVPEYTLYRKWQEIQEFVEILSSKQRQRIFELKMSIWCPKDPDDYKDIDPVVVPANTAPEVLTWTLLRIFTSSAHWSQNPGRHAKYFLMDRSTKDYLGIISLGSDFIAIGGRDKYIGWTTENKIKDKKLNYIAMVSSLVPTQPIGYTYVGGKLVSLLSLSDVIENDWNSKYRSEKLLGLTTTSLYGGFSQYNNLNYWRKCDSTEGLVPIEPSEHVYEEIKIWVEENFPGKLKEIMNGTPDKVLPTHPKNSILYFAYKNLGIKSRETKASRGVYYAKLYTKTNEFLSGISEDYGNKIMDNSVESLTNLWKEKYASKRVKNLLETDRYKTDLLFYDGMIGLSWEKAKEKYLEDVGR